ncbi:MAG: DUF72 domain-containing protein [Fimbriimonas sp.]
MAHTWVGLSGFSYEEWQGEGLFYPPTTKASGFFAYYQSRYESVEMDGSWYQMPGEASVKGYIKNSHDRFRFCFKAHRKITHLARLKEAGLEPLQFMLHRIAPLALVGKLGPILMQLPPNLKRDDDRLRTFFERAPRFYPKPDSAEWRTPELTDIPVQYAVEFRHESWRNDEVEALLRGLGLGWVAADVDELDAQRRVPAAFAYARFRKSDYPEELLADWAAWLRNGEANGIINFVFCKHQDAERPWDWADRLRELLGQ